MSSCGWKLSAAIALLFASSAAAQESLKGYSAQDRLRILSEVSFNALEEAQACSMEAATVYAQLSQETARKVSELSHRKCKDLWGARAHVAAQKTLVEMEIAGETVPADVMEDPLQGLSEDILFPERSIRNLEASVVDWRARAQLEGDGVYKGLRATFKQNLDRLRAQRGEGTRKIE